MVNAFILYPLGEQPDKRDRVCATCYYSEPSLNLLWCSKHEMNVILVDDCGQWASDKCRPKETQIDLSNGMLNDDAGDDWGFD